MTDAKPLRAAIVGLGQVGMKFDEDPRRSGVWTHFSAYERLADDFDLVAVCDPDSSRVETATRRRASVRGYSEFAELLEHESLDVVSLCTPPELHAAQIRECAGRVRAVICEKPLSDSAGAGEAAVRACEQSGTLLAVNYYKRFDGVVPAVKKWIDANCLGRLKLVNALYCGPVDAVGSHMVDLLRFFFGELELEGQVTRNADRHLVSFQSGSGALVHLHNLGPREEFVFELDALGDEGRVRVLNNASRVEFFRYRESTRYSGYRELFPDKVELPAPSERFLPLFQEVAGKLRNPTLDLTSSGADALRTQRLIDAMAQKIFAA